jgi:hypothetical protein
VRYVHLYSRVGVSFVALTTLLAGPVYAVAQRHGGAPAAPHFSAPHVSAPHFSAAPHFNAAPHFSAAPHFNAAPPFNAAPHFAGVPHFRAAPHLNAAPHFAGRLARPGGRPRGHAGRIVQAPGPSVHRFHPHVPSATGHNVASARNPPNARHAPNVRRNVERNTVQHGNAGIGTRNARNAPVEHNAVRQRNATAHAVHQALIAPAIRNTLRHPADLRDPRTRSFVAAAAATAGWHGRHEWWRHRHGGFGWVGPLFWPFAYYDVYDYALWGDDYDVSFWDYGYSDIYAALFAPYGYDELVGYLPDYAVGESHYASREISAGERTRSVAAGELATMCGDDTRNIAGVPIEQIRQALQLDDQQRAALDALADASTKAAQVIKEACPADIALTAPGRLEFMQHRVAAMIQAVQIVQPPLEKFYSLLSDEQKARLTALGEEQNRATSQAANKSSANGSLSQICSPGQAALTWPTDDILKAVRPNHQQRAKLDRLKDATTKAAEGLEAACPAQTPLTPPARLAAVAKRLDAMLSAIKTVRTALNDFYDSLNDEQKAQFDAIGPQRTASG